MAREPCEATRRKEIVEYSHTRKLRGQESTYTCLCSVKIRELNINDPRSFALSVLQSVLAEGYLRSNDYWGQCVPHNQDGFYRQAPELSAYMCTFTPSRRLASLAHLVSTILKTSCFVSHYYSVVYLTWSTYMNGGPRLPRKGYN